MLGILFLFIAAVWVAAAYALSRLIIGKAPDRWRGLPIRFGVFVIVLVLPFIDELIGGLQFASLCRGHSEVIVDAQRTQGRTVRSGKPETKRLSLAVPADQTKFSAIDADSGEPVYHFYRLHASGGWVARTLRFSEAGEPVFFLSTCQPQGLRAVQARLGIRHIDR